MRRILCLSLAALTLLPVATAGAASTVTVDDPIGRYVDSVGSVTSTSATLNGRILPKGNLTHWQFLVTAPNSAPNYFQWAPSQGTAGVFTQNYYAVSTDVTGLSPNTEYEVKLTATIDGQSTIYYSYATTFTTAAAQQTLPPVFTPGSSTGHQEAAPAPATSNPDSDGTAPQAQPATPVAGQSAGVAPAAGTVLVKEPGTGRYVPLKAGDVIPLGSTLDTSRGTVALTTALPGGKTQTGYFNGGQFQVKQGRDGYADLYLRGPVCSRRPAARRSSAGASAASVKRRSGRRLFGRDNHGKFRTHGKNSQATVRGTRWMTEDRCDGTLTTVSQGAVSVKDFHKKRPILVKAGGRYLARAHR